MCLPAIVLHAVQGVDVAAEGGKRVGDGDTKEEESSHGRGNHTGEQEEAALLWSIHVYRWSTRHLV